jgi:phosphoribosyl 1,2-cyclic phosphate phosphodiesterase
MKKIEGSQIMVLNALHYDDHISHYTVPQAIELINQIHPEKGIFIHMSHRLGLHDEEEQKLPNHMKFAFDGMKIDI